MANNFGWQVTVVLDKKPFGQSREMKEACTSASYFWPPEPLSYAAHTTATQFTGEMVNVSKVANFIDAFKLAREENEPDHILINTPDAVEAALNLNLHKKYPITFYTHYENLVVPMNKASKVFGLSYNGFLYTIPQVPGIAVATQCDYNLVRMGHLSFATLYINLLRVQNVSQSFSHLILTQKMYGWVGGTISIVTKIVCSHTLKLILRMK